GDYAGDRLVVADRETGFAHHGTVAFGVRQLRHDLLEPLSFGERGMLEQSDRCRLRRDEVATGFCFGEAADRVNQLSSRVVERGFEQLALGAFRNARWHGHVVCPFGDGVGSDGVGVAAGDIFGFGAQVGGDDLVSFEAGGIWSIGSASNTNQTPTAIPSERMASGDQQSYWLNTTQTRPSTRPMSRTDLRIAVP